MQQHALNFSSLRYGLFIHYGLYSLPGRGEWVFNRERWSRNEMLSLSRQFDPSAFDAEKLCDLAATGGMRYLVLTTMHHEGFRLYRSNLTDFHAPAVCGRDLVEELVTAARTRGLRIGLYHSLNNWFDQPDAADALEDHDAYETFIGNTFERLRELALRFNPVDILWYDGWWPFDATGWRAEAMNAMIRDIQPHILFNGRNGLPGDFGTPEGHMSAPDPWRPWEACMTLHDHWGYHRGDANWKSAGEVVRLLAQASQGHGNLLLNIGLMPDGSVPAPAERTLRSVGEWMAYAGEAVMDTDRFAWGLQTREGLEADWSHHGPITRKGRDLYQLMPYWPGEEWTLAGLDADVESVTLLRPGGGIPHGFEQKNRILRVFGLPPHAPDPVCPVLRCRCRTTPTVRLGGGMRVPGVPHPPYDPCPSDIAH